MMRKSDSLVVFDTIPFNDIIEYIRDYTNNGDYIIPLCGDVDSAFEEPTDIHKDPDDPFEYLETYDERLLRVYRRYGGNIVLKNVKLLGAKNNGGILLSVMELCKKANWFMEKVLGPLNRVVVSSLQNTYDSKFRDECTNQVPNLVLWIPVYSLHGRTGVMIRLFDRISVIMS